MNLLQLARRFKEESGTVQTAESLQTSIKRVSTIIHSFDHIDENTKVKLLFALSAPVNAIFLKELKERAIVEVDEKNRITYYEAIGLELSGYHTSKTDYWTTDPEYIDLLNYLIKTTECVKSSMNITQLAREFKEKSGTAQTVLCLRKRIINVRTRIHSFEHIDTNTKVKLMFALNASVDEDFLEELKKEAIVEIGYEKRITHFKANNGSLKLREGHNQSTKLRTSKFKLNRIERKLISDYFENDTDTVPETEEEKKMWNLIEFITEKCRIAVSPLIIRQLDKDFNEHFGLSRSVGCIQPRIKAYCNEIQKLESLDTLTKIKQLFCLSATLSPVFLQELRKDALVEVDDMNRITKYTANNGRFSLHGDHSSSAKMKLGWHERRKDKKTVKNQCNSSENEESEKESDYLEQDSDEYSSEEFENEFHLENGDNETRVRNSSLSKMSIHNNLDFDPPFGRSHKSEEIEMREDDRGKRKNSYPTAPTPEKKRNKDTTGTSSSNWTGSFSNNSMRPNEVDDYDTNYSMVDQVKLEPFRGSIQEDFKEIEEDEDIQQIPKPLQALDEHNQLAEVPIKTEYEEPVENSTEPLEVKPVQILDKFNELIEVPIKTEQEETVEVKPESSHNSKIKFFATMQSLILCIDTPSLSWIQLEIHQKFRKIIKTDVILNNEIALVIELLISRLTNHSVVNLPENVESVNLSNFFCFLKAAILNSKMNGVEGLVNNISELIEESQNKRIPMEEIANALCATLDADGF